jgi:uncharacterized membrane protein
MTVKVDRPRGILFVTLASLGFNLFLCGILVAQFFMHPPRPPMRGPDPGHFIDRLADELQPKDAEILRRTFDAHRPAIASAIDLAHDAREQVRIVLEEPSLDPARLQAALDQANAKSRALETALQQTMTEAVLQMSGDGRRHLAGMMPVGPPPPPPPRP